MYDVDRKIVIDASNGCSIECPKCPRQDFKRAGLPVPGRLLQVEDFIKIAEFFTKRIEFVGQISDPIMNKHLPEFLRMCYERQTPCKVNTASSHRSIEWFKKCFEINPNTLWTFGIDGLPEQSHLYRVKQDGVKLFEVMKMGVEMGVDVKWQYIVFKYNQESIDEASELANKHGIEFELNLSTRFDGPQDPYRPDDKYVKQWDVETKEFSPRCMNGAREIALSATGFLYPCCWTDLHHEFTNFVADDKLNIRNVSSVEEILSSELWQKHFYILENAPDMAPLKCKQMCSTSGRNPNRDKIILT